MSSRIYDRSSATLPALPLPDMIPGQSIRPNPPRTDQTRRAEMMKACAVTPVSYFYGRISRDEAERVLLSRRCKQGLFLLRENVDVAGNYALSICHKNGIHHYSIERQPDGTVRIPRGWSFKGPVELVTHHKTYRDGLVTKPAVACERPEGVAPMAWPGVTSLELEHALLEKAEKQKLTGAKLENALGPQRQKFVSLVAKTLHEEQDWFHGPITREQAESAIAKSGHRDGKFLVRVRDKKSYALTLSYSRAVKHYKIDKRKRPTGDEYLSIEDGLHFENLMDVSGAFCCCS